MALDFFRLCGYFPVSGLKFVIFYFLVWKVGNILICEKPHYWVKSAFTESEIQNIVFLNENMK